MTDETVQAYKLALLQVHGPIIFCRPCDVAAAFDPSCCAEDAMILQMILAFVDNWQQTGGADEYQIWGGGQSGSGEQHLGFFTDPFIKQTYKNFVDQLIHRVNSINGRVYRDDPTIMAWDLINEPRCQRCPPGTIHVSSLSPPPPPPRRPLHPRSPIRARATIAI